MKVIRDGVEVNVPVSQMTDEERRAYNRDAKARSRAAAREAEKIAQAEPKDPSQFGSQTSYQKSGASGY